MKKSRGRHPGASRDPLLHHIELFKQWQYLRRSASRNDGPGLRRDGDKNGFRTSSFAAVTERGAGVTCWVRSLKPAIPFHHLENLNRGAGRFVGVAVYSSLDIHNMLLQRMCFLSIRSLPQDRCQVTHCRQAVGMLLSE